jgi:hypothetical protein
MKLFYSLLVFGICLQCTCYLFQAFQVLPITYPASVTSLESYFSIENIIKQVSMAVGGAALIGVIGLLLRQNTYAIYGMLIWGISMFIPVVNDFFLTIPATLSALVPAEVMPTGYAVNPIFVVIGVVFAVGAWFFLMELITQRQIA